MHLRPLRSSRSPGRLFVLAALAAAGTVACHRKSDPTRDNFTQAMNAYLTERGDLCLGKAAWPIDVTQHEFQVGSRNAVQMPVLERVGLVRGSDARGRVQGDEGSIAVDVKRYELTDAGREYVRSRGMSDGGVAQSDFCVARLGLDSVVRWDISSASTAVVTYTYTIDAAPFTADPEIQRVFPAVDRVVRGAGSDQLQESFTLTRDGWVANELLGHS